MENQELQNQEVNNQQSQSYGMSQIPLPNATVVLVLGILSIVGCCCYGIIGIVCGIVALIMAKTAKALYDSDPSTYTEGSMSNVNTGRICAIIGLILSCLYLLFSIIVLAIYGLAALSDPQSLMNAM